MSANYSLLFYLKKPKNYAGGPQPIYMRLTVEGRRSEISTGRKCEPDRWNPHANRAKGTKEMIRQLNQHLDTIERKVHGAYLELVNEDAVISIETLKKKYLREDEKKSREKMLIEVFEAHNKKVESLIGKDYSKGTHKNFEYSLNHLRNFLAHYYDVTDYIIADIDLAFIENYEFYLKTEKGCIPITAQKYIKHLRKIINFCLSHRWITENPFAFYKSTAKPTPKSFLSAEELRKIESKELSNPRLRHVRDIFVFCCYTGLTYGDVKKLKRSDIVIGFDGSPWITTNRQKTSVASNLPLLPQALEIINRYQDYPPCVQSGLALPVKSNQKMNEYLKEIADLSDVSKNLTFHLSRHTFATTVTLANRVPIETVARMMGHTKLKTTQHYAKLLDTRVKDDMLQLEKKLSSGHSVLSDRS
ncbi:site-specific integrase [Sinomicrobium oceani]|uniref:site-specific integrase n=1 Tax=Sinomicrobium oceani TaxID=1150368 RepID=UPI00227CF162|nr:site-specific integrase [Sinomicrobium oceani]